MNKLLNHLQPPLKTKIDIIAVPESLFWYTIDLVIYSFEQNCSGIFRWRAAWRGWGSTSLQHGSGDDAKERSFHKLFDPATAVRESCCPCVLHIADDQ